MPALWLIASVVAITGLVRAAVVAPELPAPRLTYLLHR